MFRGELPGPTCPLATTALARGARGCPASHVLEPSPTATVPPWPLLLSSRGFSFMATITPRGHHPAEGEVLFRLWLDTQWTRKTLFPGQEPLRGSHLAADL